MPQNPAPEPEQLLTPSEVAAMFRVNPKTVTRWARAGKISAIRTLGGHRRFRASEIRKFLEQVDEAHDRALTGSGSPRRRPGRAALGPGRSQCVWPGPASIR